MTIEELRQILHQLHLDYDAQPNLIYIFYTTDDGLVNNFSISLHSARQRNRRPMTVEQLGKLMEQYPATAHATVTAVEHPREGLRQWLGADEVCRRLNTSRRSLLRWVKAGMLHPATIRRRQYFDADEVDRMLADNVVDDHGRIDSTAS